MYSSEIIVLRPMLERNLEERSQTWYVAWLRRKSGHAIISFGAALPRNAGKCRLWVSVPRSLCLTKQWRGVHRAKSRELQKSDYNGKNDEGKGEQQMSVIEP